MALRRRLVLGTRSVPCSSSSSSRSVFFTQLTEYKSLRWLRRGALPKKWLGHPAEHPLAPQLLGTAAPFNTHGRYK